MYFKDFPEIFYIFRENGTDVLRSVTDITANVRLRTAILQNVTIYDEYDVRDGDTPDIIAAKYYGSSEYHWAILLANGMYNWRNDWPLSNRTLDDYIRDKYNRFVFTSWDYSGTTVTATLTAHGIELDGTDTITVEDAYTAVTGATTAEVTITAASTVNGESTIDSLATDTITFEASGAIVGAATGPITIWTENREYLTKHYELNSYIVDSDTSGAAAVDYYTWEVAQNEAKRRIKLITPDVVVQMSKELKELI